MSSLTLDPATTALVLIDLQRGIASSATIGRVRSTRDVLDALR